MPKRILVVDDDPDFVLTTGHALRSAGYEVITAESTVDALSKLDEQGPVDLFILDAMMETYTAGFELAHELRRREQTRQTPILVLTAIEQQFGGQFDTEQDVQALGVNVLLRKPVRPDDLLKNVREMID